MLESMNPGNDNAQVVNMIKALIQKSIDNETATQEINRLILAQAARVGALEEDTAAARSDIGEVKGKVATIDNNVRQTAQKLLSSDLALSLKADLHNHAELFNKPLKRNVHITHYLGWQIWMLVSSVALTLFLCFCLYQSSITASKYRENDIKWRHMKLSRASILLNGTLAADSLYQANPDQFRSDVEFEEKRRERYNAKLWLKAQTQEEINDLESQEKKR